MSKKNQQLNKPRILPYPVIFDERGFGAYNLFSNFFNLNGQLNITTTYPGVKRAWHRHQKQTDYMAIVRGNAIVAVWKEDQEGKIESEKFCIGEHNSQIVAIPPGWWHGITPIGDEPCTMIYFVTNRYDPQNLDEERILYDELLNNPEYQDPKYNGVRKLLEVEHK